MTKYVTSKALCYNKVNNGYEIVNFLSGKSVKVSEFVKDFLNYCELSKESSLVEDFFTRSNVPVKESMGLMQFLLSHKILVHDDQEALYCVCPVAHTLFGFESCDEIKIPENNIIVVGAPFGLGNSVDIGCKDFPKHIRRIVQNYFGGKKLILNLHSFRVDFVHHDFNMKHFESLINASKIKDIGDIYYCSGESNDLYYDKITRFISKVIEKHSIPFVLGGDHSITYPVLKAFCSKESELDVFHFDAHSDFKDSIILTMYNKMDMRMLTHATVMNYCLEEESIKCIYQFGVREPYRIENSKIKSVSLYDIRTKSDLYMQAVETKRPVYLTFDIDFFDPILAPGTGSRISQGAWFEETIQCLEMLLQNKRIVGVDIVEVNDNLDSTSNTSLLAMKLILFIIGLINLEKNE